MEDGTDGANLNQPQAIVVQGNYAYVCTFAGSGFQIIDISNPYNPTAAGQLTNAPGDNLLLLNNGDIAVQGNYAYVASRYENGIQIIDISDPYNPIGVGNIKDSDGDYLLRDTKSIFVQGNLAYTSSWSENGIQVTDISDPTNPIGVDNLESGDEGAKLWYPATIFVKGNFLYAIASAHDAFQVISLGKNNLYGLEVGSLDVGSIHVANLAQFGNYVDIRGGLSVSASTNIQGSLSVAKEFIDSNGDGGDAGQVLSAIKTGTGTSTITGTKWISKNVTNLRVVDSDSTLEITDGTLIISGVSTDTITITLPQANTFTAGSYYTIKRLDNGATPSSVSLLGDVSDTIEGGTNTFTITADKTAIVIQTDGINQWYILSNY